LKKSLKKRVLSFKSGIYVKQIGSFLEQHGAFARDQSTGDEAAEPSKIRCIGALFGVGHTSDKAPLIASSLQADYLSPKPENTTAWKRKEITLVATSQRTRKRKTHFTRAPMHLPSPTRATNEHFFFTNKAASFSFFAYLKVAAISQRTLRLA
jgi:hypothetical protein